VGLLQKGSNNLIPYASDVYNTRGNGLLPKGLKTPIAMNANPTTSGFGTP
jgi:hypothetical protein